MADRRGFEPARTPSLAEGVDRRQQMVAFAWIGGLVLFVLGLWMVAILTSGDDGGLEIAAEPVPAPQSAVPHDDDPDDEAAEEDPDPEGSDDADPAADDADPAPDPDPDGADADVTSVTIDEVCTVELRVTERDDTARLRAWDYPDCAYAPVTVEERRERWIVVRASMSSGDFDVEAAEERADELGVDGGVLWSSHYPSLNPDLWVVYEGPFEGRDDARDAAEAVDGEAYARALTVDDGDRFCIAADGCRGERAD